MRFSDNEKIDLLKAWVIISLAVAIYEIRQSPVVLGFSQNLALLVQAFVIYAVTVGAAFLAHEVLGHKLVAQRHRLSAEFWADNLLLSLALLSPFLGFVFAAPGAVVISGVAQGNTYGKIAAAGPAVNLILAILFSLLIKVGIDNNIVSLSYSFNSWFALFNLLPFGVLDGAKIVAWDKRVWLVMMGVSLLLFLRVI
jgi:Zn-dependent protease